MINVLKIFKIIENNSDFKIDIQGTIEDPLFHASQIGELLGFSNIREIIRDFEEDERKQVKVKTEGGAQTVNYLTEIGLYRLIGRSRKPLARTFQRWVVNVIKEIRTTGMYSLDAKKDVDKELIVHQTELNAHTSFLKAFHAKNVVYLCRMKYDGNDKNKIIVKIGSTQNIKERMTNIAHKYENIQPIVLFVVENNSHVKLESFYQDHPFIRQFNHRLPMKTGKQSTETFLVNEEQLSEFIKIMDENKSKFHDSSIELEKTRLRTEELINETLESRLKLSEDRIRLKEIELQVEQLKLLNKKRKTSSDDEDTPSEKSDVFYPSDEDESDAEEDVVYVKKRNNGFLIPLVYQYSLEDLSKPIEIYDCPADVERKLSNLEISPSALKNAAKRNTIYKGYRWLYVNRGDVTNQQPTTLPETVATKHKPPDVKFLAMIDIKQTKIVEVFQNQKQAAEAQNLKSNSFTRAIQQNTISRGHYWKFFNDCSEEMQKEYLSRAKLPEPFIRSTGKCVQQIDPKTGKVIATFHSNREVVKKFQMSILTLKNISESGAVHRGFKWKIIADSRDENKVVDEL